jgi:toxin secretion/phage lysis holin
MSKILVAIGGGVGALIAYVTSWSPHVETLCILMCVDFLFGILTPVITGRSKKDPNGKISSHVCRRGVVKKCTIFCLIYVAWLLSSTLHAPFVTDAIVLGFIISETISILENASVLGVPIPKIFLKLLRVMNDKASIGIDILANGTVIPEKEETMTLEGVKKQLISEKEEV